MLPARCAPDESPIPKRRLREAEPSERHFTLFCYAGRLPPLIAFQVRMMAFAIGVTTSSSLQ